MSPFTFIQIAEINSLENSFTVVKWFIVLVIMGSLAIW